VPVVPKRSGLNWSFCLPTCRKFPGSDPDDRGSSSYSHRYLLPR
jgi:hypothetical protein